MGFKRHGTLPTILQDLIQLDSRETVFRMGMPISPSSLLHCLVASLNNKDYFSIATDNEREEFVQTVRKGMNVNPGLMAQELWDQAPDRRLHTEMDPDVYLDPSLVYSST